MGTAVAEKVAETLGYECLSRAVLLETSKQFDISEEKLTKAIVDAPSILERLGHRKQAYVAFIQAALTRHVAKDNIVYHGRAGHVLLKNVSHVLKVRIVAEMELRESIVMEQEGLSREEANTWITKVDKGRLKWTKTLYDADPSDPSLYDLLVNIPRFSVEEAAALICQTAKLPQFAATTDSQRAMDDLALACEVKAALVDRFPDAWVSSRNGNVLVYIQSGGRHARKLEREVQEMGALIEGIHNIEVHVDVSHPPTAV